MALWKVGDVVHLKSGGPKMTVLKIRNDRKVNCQWFIDDDPKPHCGSFEPEMLQAPSEIQWGLDRV